MRPRTEAGGRTNEMKDSSGSRSFGLLVAYVLPGFLSLLGLAPIFPGLALWLQPVAQADLELGPPLYSVLAATMIGMILSCFRWAILDRVHGWSGVVRPALDNRRLGQVLEGFDYLVLNHFRYYEFCGNTLFAALCGYSLNRAFGTVAWLGRASDLGMAAMCIVLFAASRSALKNYYARTGELVGLSKLQPSGDMTMYNGNDHGGNPSMAAGQGGGSDHTKTNSAPDIAPVSTIPSTAPLIPAQKSDEQTKPQ